MLVGKSLQEVRFRTLFGAVVHAIRHRGEIMTENVETTALYPGDTLLIDADPRFCARAVSLLSARETVAKSVHRSSDVRTLCGAAQLQGPIGYAEFASRARYVVIFIGQREPNGGVFRQSANLFQARAVIERPHVDEAVLTREYGRRHVRAPVRVRGQRLGISDLRPRANAWP